MLKRPVACCGIVFVLSILAAFNEVNFLIIPIISVVVALAAFLYRRDKLFLVLICMIAAILGFQNTQHQIKRESRLLSAVAGKDVDAVLVVTDFSSGGKVVANLKNKDKTLKVYFSSAELGEVSPGDVIKANVTLCSADINGENFARYLYGQNVFVRAYADRVQQAGTDFSGIMGSVYKIRRYIRNSAQKIFDGDLLALYEAMVIGDGSLMTSELKEKLRGTGLNHIAVVSGMHLSIMLSVIMFVLQRIFGKNRFGAVISIAAAIFITLICGCGSSVVRACIMCVVFQIARLLYREGDALSSLFLAIIVMSAYNPYVIYNAGFILSVLSTMGIVLFSKRMGGFLGKFMPKRLCGIVTVCLCAQITVMPYLMYCFQEFTSYGLIANTLVSIFAGVLVVAGILLPILSGVPIVSSLIQMCITGAAYIIIAVCEMVQKLPKSVVNVEKPGPFMISVWIFMLCTIIMYPKSKKNLLKIGVVLFVASAVSFTTSVMQRNDASLHFIENDTRSCSAVFSEKGSVLIGCSDYYEALSLAEEKSDGAYDYFCVNEQSSSESEMLIQSGGVKNVIVCGATGGQGIERIIKCADVHGVMVSKLDFDEEYNIFENSYISFMSFGSKYENCGAVKLDYNGSVYVSLEGMRTKDVKSFAGGISCSAVRFPKLLDVAIAEFEDDICGHIITKENKFFLKGKE